MSQYELCGRQEGNRKVEPLSPLPVYLSDPAHYSTCPWTVLIQRSGLQWDRAPQHLGCLDLDCLQSLSSHYFSIFVMRGVALLASIGQVGPHKIQQKTFHDFYLVKCHNENCCTIYHVL